MTGQPRFGAHGWVAPLAALLLLTAGCAAPPSTTVTVPTAGHAPTSEPAPTPEGGMTSQELAFARDLARKEIAKQHATVTSATVTADDNGLDVSNTGQACKSRRILHIKLIGTFPQIVVSPAIGDPDPTVHAVNIDADGKTGLACQMGVQTGRVRPASGAVPLRLGPVSAIQHGVVTGTVRLYGGPMSPTTGKQAFTGQPQPGAKVSLWIDKEQVTLLHADGQGHFEVSVPAGTYSIVGCDGVASPFSDTVTVVAGQAVQHDIVCTVP